jgi:hypothetical protein
VCAGKGGGLPAAEDGSTVGVCRHGWVSPRSLLDGVVDRASLSRQDAAIVSAGVRKLDTKPEQHRAGGGAAGDGRRWRAPRAATGGGEHGDGQADDGARGGRLGAARPHPCGREGMRSGARARGSTVVINEEKETRF